MEDISELVLKELSVNTGPISSIDVAIKLKVDHQKIVGSIKSLQSLGNVIESIQESEVRWGVTVEGVGVVDGGSHEAIIFNHVPPQGSINQDDLMTKVGGMVGKVGFSKAMSLGWIMVDKKDKGGSVVARKVGKIEDKTRDLCRKVSQNKMDGVTNGEKNELKKRKLITEIKVVYYKIQKGSEFKMKVVKQDTEVTQEMINSGSWKSKQFKAYNFASKGLLTPGGHLHPLLKVRTQFRQIFLEMGFTEMPTNNFVESSFWNFDALFQPQQHPARDAHDTFFISDPATSKGFPMEYLARVKKVHSHGGYGSQGYNYDWRIEEAQKNILRTHATGVSARMLHQLATMESFTPIKFFSIDRVFRNESLDATHLAEFHQIEGLVADYHLTLGDLMGYIREFFQKYGITKLKFKPAYNPYTEPSMEIFSYHDGLKKWVEIGNSGVFRPEMLLPMGLPPKVSVIAWGLSLERPTMIKYAISNIRDLFGPRVDLQTVYDNPICRLGQADSIYPPCFGGKANKFGGKNGGEMGGNGLNNEEVVEMKLLQKRQVNLMDKLKGMSETVGGMIEVESKNVMVSNKGGEVCKSKVVCGKYKKDGGGGGIVKSEQIFKDLGGVKKPPQPTQPIISSAYNLTTPNCPLEIVLEINPHTITPTLISLILIIKSSPVNLVTSSIHSSLQPLNQNQSNAMINLFNHQETVDAFLKSGLKGIGMGAKLPENSNISVSYDRFSREKILTVIWKKSKNDVILKSANLQLSNHHAILKYLSRVHLGVSPSSSPSHNRKFTNFYPSTNAILLTCIDDILDEISSQQQHTKEFINKVEKMITAGSNGGVNGGCGAEINGGFIHGVYPSLSDLVLWGCEVRGRGVLKKWRDGCDEIFGRVDLN